MLKLKRELIEKREKKAIRLQRKNLVLSCETFLKELKRGETKISSIFFTGCVTETLLIQRLCSYYGITFKGCNKQEAKFEGIRGIKNLVCYKVEY
jgi:hypothetical protein